MEPTSAEADDLLKRVVDFFESEDIPYYIVGAVAAMKFGEPRLTADVDIVADLPAHKIPTLCDYFSMPEYYVSEAAVRDAVQRKFQFNIIIPAIGLKVDVMIPEDSAYDKCRMQRIRRLHLDNKTMVFYASPEDVIIKKLEYYKIGGSEKHIRDIGGILRSQREKIDRAYIRKWVDEMDLNVEWGLILDKEKVFLSGDDV